MVFFQVFFFYSLFFFFAYFLQLGLVVLVILDKHMEDGQGDKLTFHKLTFMMHNLHLHYIKMYLHLEYMKN